MIRRTATATGYRPDAPDILACTVCKQRSYIPRLQTVPLTSPTLHRCGGGFTIPPWDPTPPARHRAHRPTADATASPVLKGDNR